MINNLCVIKITPNGTGILVKVHGGAKTFKIESHGQILIRHKIITTDALQVGDEILAYGFDIVPKRMYNSKGRRKDNSRR